jgi:hypothetical protein
MPVKTDTDDTMKISGEGKVKYLVDSPKIGLTRVLLLCKLGVGGGTD